MGGVVKEIGYAVDPTTSRGIANIATGGMYELNSAAAGGAGGGKNGKGAPAPPDFAAAAEAQARADHANQRTPWASSQWTEMPNGQWSQNLTLDPRLQAGADSLMGQIGSQGPMGTGDDARTQAIDSAWQQATSRLDPQWQQRETAMRSQLANQGIDLGSGAFSTAMGDFGRSRNDAYTSAMADAIKQGTAAQALTFEQNRAAQMMPYQQLGMIQGLSGMPAAPGGARYLDAAGLGYQGALNAYGTQQSGKNSMLGGAMNLGALALLGGGGGGG